MNGLKLRYLVVVLAMAVPASLMAAPRSVNYGTSHQPMKAAAYQEASQLLSQIRARARDIQTSIGSLDLIARSADTDWKMECEALNDVREHVNAMGKDLTRLEDIRSRAEAWQQVEIDRILPLAKQLASNTENAIRAFNANETHVWSTEVPRDFATIRKEAGQIRSSVARALEVSKLKGKVESLEHSS
jgi:hypothetical protein